jgi:hypothetical protein
MRALPESRGRSIYGRRTRSIVAVMVLALALPAVAAAFVTYAGPKTWLYGYAGNTGYDNSSNRWWYNGMGSAEGYMKRVVFIKSDGSWAVEQHGTAATVAIAINSINYQKKAYCESLSTSAWFGDCGADAKAP